MEETQLYAKIKRSSKYFYQNEWAKRDGEFPFPVSVRDDIAGYIFIGGPGGSCTRYDVNIFVKANGRFMKVGGR